MRTFSGCRRPRHREHSRPKLASWGTLSLHDPIAQRRQTARREVVLWARVPPLATRHHSSAAVASVGKPRTRREWRRHVTVPLLSCVLALVVGATPAAGLGSARTPRCSTSHLRLSYVRELGAAGARSWDLALKNVGSATCRLHGYPGVGLLDLHGRPISVNVVRDTAFLPATVIVHHGQRAYFTLIWESAGPCEPHFYSAYGLEVFPPNSTKRLFLHNRWMEICDTSIGGHPRVTPVRQTLDGL